MSEQAPNTRPSFDGIIFSPTTDRKGVAIHPSTGQGLPPITYLSATLAREYIMELQGMIGIVQEADEASYLAVFLQQVCDDLSEAVAQCVQEAA